MYNYNWNLKDTNFTKDKGKVFSLFSCGGGSTMGYKLAGFDVIGCNEIDKKMMEVYIANHNPKYPYLEPIQEFKKQDNLPNELYNLDILDSSPPCSSFSIAGVREDAWGKEKKFREGQAEQVLDTLFFDSIEVVKKLQPKVAIHENVKGLLLGNAKKYVSEIYQKLNDAGYYTKHFLLDASKMGVPQRRERVFFISVRKDIAENILDYEIDMFDPQLKINLVFNEKPITFGEFYQPNIIDRKVSDGKMKEYWLNRHKSDKNFADTILRIENKNRCFNNIYLHKDEVPNTLTSNSDVFYLFDEYRKPNRQEICCISTFPQDYNFLNNPYNYIAGMSVPPVMMARIANEVYQQILTKN